MSKNTDLEQRKGGLDLLLKRPYAKTALNTIVVVCSLTVILFCALGNDKASQLGDAFGIAGAVLAGMALFGIAVSLHEIDDRQTQQRETQKVDSDRFEQQQQRQFELIEKQQEQINALADIARAITDPVVIARINLINNTMYTLVIENLGKRIAYDIQFEIDPKEGIYPWGNIDKDIGKLPFIRNGLPAIAPGQTISAFAASGQDLKVKRDKRIKYVSEFTLSISYHLEPTDSTTLPDTRVARRSIYKFNFDAQVHTFQHRGEIAEEIHQIDKKLEKLIESGERLRVSVK